MKTTWFCRGTWSSQGRHPRHRDYFQGVYSPLPVPPGTVSVEPETCSGFNASSTQQWSTQGRTSKRGPAVGGRHKAGRLADQADPHMISIPNERRLSLTSGLDVAGGESSRSAGLQHKALVGKK